MKASTQSTQLPAPLGRAFLRAAEDEIGLYSLQLIVSQAASPPERSAPAIDLQAPLSYAGYEALLSAIRSYYGTGARGTMLRVGRKSFQYLIAALPALKRVGLWRVRSGRPPDRRRKAVAFLASQLSLASQGVSVHQLDKALVLVDRRSATPEQTTDIPVCWHTQGLIQEALAWATGREFLVEETACRIAGDAMCKFIIT